MEHDWERFDEFSVTIFVEIEKTFWCTDREIGARVTEVVEELNTTVYSYRWEEN